jgi:hypothetical protein
MNVFVEKRGLGLMALLPTCLRVEAESGSAEEYRIRDEMIEVRQLHSPSKDESEWHRLTPEQIANHVNRRIQAAV